MDNIVLVEETQTFNKLLESVHSLRFSEARPSPRQWLSADKRRKEIATPDEFQYEKKPTVIFKRIDELHQVGMGRNSFQDINFPPQFFELAVGLGAQSETSQIDCFYCMLKATFFARKNSPAGATAKLATTDEAAELRRDFIVSHLSSNR